jgi:hypothetical protein
MRNGVTRQGFPQRSDQRNISQGPLVFCKCVILCKKQPRCHSEFRFCRALHHEMAMWPSVKLRVQLGPFTLQYESSYEASPEYTSSGHSPPSGLRRRWHSRFFRECDLGLLVRGELGPLNSLVGHFRATSNKAKLAVSNRISGMMQDLGELCLK